MYKKYNYQEYIDGFRLVFKNFIKLEKLFYFYKYIQNGFLIFKKCRINRFF